VSVQAYVRRICCLSDFLMYCSDEDLLRTGSASVLDRQLRNQVSWKAGLSWTLCVVFLRCVWTGQLFCPATCSRGNSEMPSTGHSFPGLCWACYTP
jgi:hypothetical protein